MKSTGIVELSVRALVRSKGKKRQHLCLIIPKVKNKTPLKKSEKMIERLKQKVLSLALQNIELNKQLSFIVFKCIGMTHHLSGFHRGTRTIKWEFRQISKDNH